MMATASFGRNTPLRLSSKNKDFSSTTNNIGGPAYAYDICVNLPPLPKDDDILDGGSQFLEDMESILEGVTNTSTTETVLEECRYYVKPHLFRQHRRDLTALMTENERQRLKTEKIQNNSPPGTCRTIGHDGLLERMEHYLAEGLIRALNNKQSNHNTKEIKSDDGVIPMVWVIQPTRRMNRNNKKKKDDNGNGESNIRFKFSTDFGACFYLNEKESLEFIEILKKISSKKLSPYSSCKMYYQVYTMDSSESRVVKSDAISSLIQDIVIADTTTTTTTTTNSQKEVDKTTEKQDADNDESRTNGDDDDGGNVATAAPTATTAPTSGNNVDGGSKKHGSSATKKGTKKGGRTSSAKEEGGGAKKHSRTKRFARYLNRRRLKRLIRQQVNIALGDSTNKSRNKLMVALFPFLIIWKLITRRGF